MRLSWKISNINVVFVLLSEQAILISHVSTNQRKRKAPLGLTASATWRNTNVTRATIPAHVQPKSLVEEVPHAQFPLSCS